MSVRLVISVAALLVSAPVSAAAAQSFLPMAQTDRVRLAEAFRLDRVVANKVWPGWKKVPFAVLLITDSVEYLVGHPKPTPDFTDVGADTLLHAEVWARHRVFPKQLLATAPFVGGVNTIAVGRAENTGKSSVEWVLSLMHEHFHQLQYTRPWYQARVKKLDLMRGDSTGMWMLNFPFPYDSAPVTAALEHLGQAFAAAVDDPLGDFGPSDPFRRARALRDSTRQLVSAADDRYLEFQLWQEGVARYTEYAVAVAAQKAGLPSAEFRALPDYEDYAAGAVGELALLHRELADERPAENKRVIVYSLGAATALMLDGAGLKWRKRYFKEPFALEPYFASR